MTLGDSAPWTISRLLEWTRAFLTRRQVASPKLCAEILLAHALGCERIRLYTRFDEVPSDAVLATFRESVRQAGDGRPIAYLTGTKEFFSLPFEVTPDVLIPRPETEVLVERAIDVLRREARAATSILDLGTGSGCIAISLAKYLPNARLCASDISEAALAVARRNATRHGLAERIEFRCGDLFAPWQSSAVTHFDVIVCNPPYVATSGAPVERAVRDYEPRGAVFAGRDGLDVIRRVLNEAPPRLRSGGHLLMEMAFDQGGAVRVLADRAEWQDVATYRDGGGHERVLHARRAATAEQSQVA